MIARAQGTAVYRQDRKSAATGAHYADSCAADLGEIAPSYRGFIVRCLAAELPAKQRAIDAFWSRASLPGKGRFTHCSASPLGLSIEETLAASERMAGLTPGDGAAQ